MVRVEDMPAAIGKDGKELLQAAPGVWIDDKKITINGKSGAKVMVNDRELRMDQSQLLTYLRSLKAEDVSKIEVIPQAGAEYSADTAGGIIKITLKRNRADGVMGNVSLIGSVSKTSATVTPSASVNVKNGKWTFSANSNLSASPKSYFDTGETTEVEQRVAQLAEHVGVGGLFECCRGVERVERLLDALDGVEKIKHEHVLAALAQVGRVAVEA